MSQHFAPTSRYAPTPTATLETPDGQTIIYLTRRFVPQPERLALLQTHSVAQGDRLDNVSFAYLGDPEQFWRICDANRAMRPDDLMQVGQRLRITLPDGIPELPHA
jgi:nucleoid-associated protein YgaU